MKVTPKIPICALFTWTQTGFFIDGTLVLDSFSSQKAFFNKPFQT